MSIIGFSPEEISDAMAVECIDILTIIPQGEVERFGIPFVRAKVEEGLSAGDVSKWDSFWAYFDKTWMPILESWNICCHGEEFLPGQNRKSQ